MPLEFQTFSIVTGTTYCNASCFFCISKMTTSDDLAEELNETNTNVNWRNFHKAAKLAQQSGVTTVLLTGKGEPTLYPNEISAYLDALDPYGFPLIELQTNGIAFQSKRFSGKKDYLGEWYDRGLSTAILSIVHSDDEKNREIYLPKRSRYPSLIQTIRLLHEKGLSVRLSVIMLDGLIDTPEAVDELVGFCRDNDVEQLTLRPVTKAEMSHDPAVAKQTQAAIPKPERVTAVHEHVEKKGKLLLKLVHGARVYDYCGQNLCLTNCLTLDPDEEELRSLIFFSTGELVYDWQYAGAVLLGGHRQDET